MRPWSSNPSTERKERRKGKKERKEGKKGERERHSHIIPDIC
jgi:hypothetical protein